MMCKWLQCINNCTKSCVFMHYKRRMTAKWFYNSVMNCMKHKVFNDFMIYIYRVNGK